MPRPIMLIVVTNQFCLPKRCREFLPSSLANSLKAAIFHAPQMNRLSNQGLRVSIAEQEIIRGLSLEVPKGEVHAIMGPNGSCKSTLPKVLASPLVYKAPLLH